MHENLERLIRLQKVMMRLKEVEKMLENIPEDFQPIYKGYHELKEEREGWMARVEELKALRKEKDEALEEWKLKRQKLKSHSAHIASQKDYSAYVKAMDEITSNMKALEEDILNAMVQQEELEKKLTETEQTFSQLSRDYEEGMKRWEEDQKKWQKEKESLLREKSILEGELPEELRTHFWYLYQKRNGLAVVPVKKKACGGCHVALRPQQYAEIRSGRTIQRCDACNRFLYYVEE